MKINYFFRHPKVGFSIQRVLQTVVLGVQREFQTEDIFLPNPKSGIRAIFQNGFFVRNRQAAINHVTGDAHYLLYFLNKINTVVTVHDIMYYSCLSGLKKKLWKVLYINSLKRAKKVIFISDFAKKQVLNEINLEANKYLVIPNPVSPDFICHDHEFNDEKPRVLHIGGKLERKNLPRTIEALKDLNCHLRIIGRLSERNRKLLDDSKLDYSNVFDLTNEEIVNEYVKSDIINFPSLFEGFGMPIIEGQAVGRIVITSNLAPMNQVAGEGAVLVNPEDVEGIKQAYLKVIGDKEFRNSIKEKGFENVKKYQLDKITKQYIELYNEIAP